MRPAPLATIAIALTLVAAARPAAAGEPSPEDVVGAWKGKATWKGCTVAGGAQVTVVVTWTDGTYQVDLAGARDDLGTVALLPRDDGTVAGTRDDLKVTMKPGASARLTLGTEAGCAATMTLARDASGLASCDRLTALATIESTCAAAGDGRGAHLDDARARLAGWKKARGAKKKDADAQCRTDGDALASSLGEHGCLPGAGGGFGGGATGIPQCDAYIALIQRYAQCPKLPVQAKQALLQAVGQLADGWKMLRDPATPKEAKQAAGEACKQAVDALTQSMAAMGCP